MRLYLAGPMRNYPLWNFPAFDRAAADLRSMGHVVWSPAELDREVGFDEHMTTLPEGFIAEAMRRDIEALLMVDAIALMDGWRDSAGSRFELSVAEMLGLDVFEVGEGGETMWLMPLTAVVATADDIKAILDKESVDVTNLTAIDEQRRHGLHLPQPGATADARNETTLETAQRLVHGNRGEDYGHPADDFARTGRMWGAILGIDDVPPEHVGLCMAAVKISREVHRPKRDNRVDLAGYAETVEMVMERRETEA